MNTKIAILIFANSAEKEAVLKPFPSSVALFETLNSQTLAIAKKTGLPYFHYSEKQQVGNTFGERFTNAIQSVYNKGYDAVITIGNDTPHLTAKHITKTVEQLGKHDIVLGPSTDGGFYLMGLKKTHFNADCFLKLHWQKSSITQSISRLFSAKKINVLYLETLQDIDKIIDVKQLIDAFKSISKKLVAILHAIFSQEKNISRYKTLIAQKLYEANTYNKGSPLYI